MRDIQQLIDKCILIKEDTGGRSTSYFLKKWNKETISNILKNVIFNSMKKQNYILLSFFIIVTLVCKQNAIAAQLNSINSSTDNFPQNAFWYPINNFTNKVPAVYIYTKGNTILNEPKVQALIQIQIGDTIVSKSNIGIEYRGSTSFRLFEQKSYGFELRDAMNQSTDSAIMDFPKQSDFILYAPANDKSLIRNTLIYDLSNQLGMYAVRTKYVQLFINGKYDGLYVLMEKIKRDKNRVNIAKLATTDNNSSEITGGYILKIDKSAGDNDLKGWEADAVYKKSLGFRSDYDPNGEKIKYAPYGRKRGSETYIMYEYPKSNAITNEQKNYLQQFFNDFENSLLSSDYSDPKLGYAQYINLNSFIDFLLLNELAYNPDGYRLSTYMNKDRVGKLNMGPIWDFNLGFGNDDRSAFTKANTWMFNYNKYYADDTWLIHFWWNKLLLDSNFVCQLKTRWNQLRSSIMSEANIKKTIQSHTNTLQMNNSIETHFERWKILGVRLPFNNFVGKTHQEEIDFIQSWIQKRLSWMDKEITKL